MPHEVATRSRHARTTGLTAGLVLILAPAVSHADLWIDFGRGDSVAIDQPRVTYFLQHSQTGDIDGPDPINNAALLDTGANGIVLAQGAYRDIWGDVLDRYAVATRDDGSRVQYEELGVAGTALFDVLEEYDLNFAGYSPDAAQEAIQNVRPLGNSSIDFGGFSAIVGMPAMMNRQTTVRLRTLLEPDDFLGGYPYVRVDFDEPASTTAGSQQNNGDDLYDVDLRMWMPPHSDPVQEGDPTPTFTPMPFVDNVRIGRDGNDSSGSFLLDTGAQISIISEAVAEGAGIDPVEDAEDWMEVGGVGGSTLAPLVSIDKLDLPSTRRSDGQAVDMRLSDLYVIVLDIGEPLIDEPLDGILGMNILSSGYALAVIEELLGGSNPLPGDDLVDGGELTDGYFEQFVLNFTDNPGDAFGQMTLQVNPDHNHVVPEPASFALLAFGGTLALLRPRRTR